MSDAEPKVKAGLSIDRAAFILLRVKRVFRKKKQQLKEKSLAAEKRTSLGEKPPPLLRSRTLPSIVVPGLSILQAQIDPRYKPDGYRRAGGSNVGLHPHGCCSDDTLQGRLAFHRLSSPEHPVGMVETMRCLEPPKTLRSGSHASLSSTALNRLAKLISQKGCNLEAPEDNAFRRLSWEKRGSTAVRIQRSSSIDSIEKTWPHSDPPVRRVPSPLNLSASPALNWKLKGARSLTQHTEHPGQDQLEPPKGLANPAFQESPVSGVVNPAFVTSPIESGLVNPTYEASPLNGGLCNDGFILSPDNELSPTEVRFDSTPRKARADRHRQRWVAEELNTLYEQDEVAEREVEVSEMQRKHSLADYMPTFPEKPRGSMRRLLRAGSLRIGRNREAKGKSTPVAPLSNVRELNGVSGGPDYEAPGTQADPAMDFSLKIAARKKLEKISNINIHLHALFSAVERGHVEKVRTILETNEVDINGLNKDHLLTPLDVALLNQHVAVARLLISKGARSNSEFETPEKLYAHLRALSVDTEQRLGSLLPAETLNNNGSVRGLSQTNLSQPPPSITGCHGGADKEKELLCLERRSALLKRMLLAFQQARPPDVPSLVVAEVRGTRDVSVRFLPPESQESGLCTRVKVQWSETERFDVVSGEIETWDVRGECHSTGLTQGRRYWFRAACANIKGYGQWRPSTPGCLVPSSWRDGGTSEPRFSLCLQHLEDLFAEVRQLRPESASEIKDFPEAEKPGETPALPRRNVKKKTTIKQLFTTTGKFHKNLKRGVFLSSLFYHEDKVLLTNEDWLPCVEVDETYPSCYHNDLHWLMKVAATWDDVKCLRQDMERHLTSTTSHFRIKLLQAAQQMQSALNTDDLGQLHFQPIRDEQGTLVLTSVRHISNPKSISVLNMRWVPLSKLQKKIPASNDESSAGDQLMNSIQSQITHHEASNVRLERGLYLCYLKLRSSVDLIHIIVSKKFPNVLPNCKVRDNPHVSLEEWEWLKRMSGRHKATPNERGERGDVTEQQVMFLEQVAGTARRLFSDMDVPLTQAMCHRVYDLEVVELSGDVSLLVVVPPADICCSAPGQEECLLRDDLGLMSLSIQVFEMTHLTTYQPDVITRYSRLSCILELYLILAQHSQREAFSTAEVAAAKEHLRKLQEIQMQLNAVWKSVRWIMDVIAFTRDRGPSNNGVPLAQLLALTNKSKCLKDKHGVGKRTLLDTPEKGDPRLARSNICRGSWSGSALQPTALSDSFSRSEQRLDKLPGQPPTITCTRASSRLPPSRSEDQLLTAAPVVRPSTTSVSATNSPLLQPRHLSAHNADSLRSVSSDESTAAVVSLPVTTPFKNPRDFSSLRSLPEPQTEFGYSYKALTAPHLATSRRPSPPTPETIPEDSYLMHKIKPHPLVEKDNYYTKPIPLNVVKPPPPSLPSPDSDNYIEPYRMSNRPPSEPDVHDRSFIQPLTISEPLDFPHRNACSSPGSPLRSFAPPLRAGSPSFPPPMRPSSSLLSLAKPALTDKRPSLLSGNAIPVNIPMRNSIPALRLSNQLSPTMPPAVEDEDDKNDEDTVGVKVPTPSSGVLQVYAAYDTGLASGTSLQLHVTPRTSAREVVDLVVKQLNMAVLLKGRDKPIYTQDELGQFCLVAVIGARERCLRDDFKPLQLQNPWKKGRLYVRQKQDVLAAIEFNGRSARQTAFL